MELQTRFTEAYGLTTPIAQAGMAFVGMVPELAVAVSNAGALGAIGVGLMPVPAMIAVVEAVRAGTDGPFHLNFITPFTKPEQIEAVCAVGVPVVSFHWGHPPRTWIDRLHASGVRVFEQIGTVADAERAVADGVDVVVAQGQEAGGHVYASLPTLALVPLVVDAVAPALVLAAGGIADGRGLAAALMLGADGAWIGTRLVATAESAAHEDYKSRLTAAEGTDTACTSIFGRDVPRFNPMRVLRNRLVGEWHERADEVPDDTSDLPVVGRTRINGEPVEMHRFSSLLPLRDVTTGDLEEMAMPAGQGVGLVGSVEPAGRVIDAITAQACDMLGRYHSPV
jgi:enoyl-[acyl-carrier protein] reductase II